MARTVRSVLLLAWLEGAAALSGTIGRTGQLEVERPSTGARKLADAPNPYTCSDGVKAAKEDWKVFGTNIGGWLVLEPWITPSLFYQFLGTDLWGAETPSKTAMDSYTFCAVLGPEEANRQLRRHWKSFLTETEIKAIAATGATHVRIPVGDWMYEPYGPYVGCMDGALDELDRALALCEKHKLGVLLDIHAVKGSQNGFDNSGQALRVEWNEIIAQGSDSIGFSHWPLRSADWVGTFDVPSVSYPKIDLTNVNMTLRVIDKLVARHRAHPAVWGIEPVNEPWQFIPIEVMKEFYWKAYWIVRKAAPKWRYVMHDSFRGYPAAWWDFMKGCPNKAMDSHIYLAWNNPGIIETFHSAACGFAGGVKTMEDQVDMPIIVGEWSLATDNCAMWLNGFNDNLPGFPKVTCSFKPCAAPYMGWEQPGCPPDDSLPLQGPYGTGVSGPVFGMCPVGVPWGPNGKNEDDNMKALTMKQLRSFGTGHGWFFWNFRTELEPRWSFIDAYFKGWFPKNVSDPSVADVVNACEERTCEDQLGKPADGTTCGARINWLITHKKMSVADARDQVGHEYPDACGLCAATDDSPPPKTSAHTMVAAVAPEAATPRGAPGPVSLAPFAGVCALALAAGLFAGNVLRGRSSPATISERLIGAPRAPRDAAAAGPGRDIPYVPMAM